MGLHRCKSSEVTRVVSGLTERLDLIMIKFDNLDTAVKGLDLQIRTTLPKVIDLLAARDAEIERLKGLLGEQGQGTDEAQAVVDGVTRALDVMAGGLKRLEEQL